MLEPDINAVVIVSDHSSQEGSVGALSAAVKHLLGVSPVLLNARHFMNGGSGCVTSARDNLMLHIPAENLVVAPSQVLIYEIPPERRREFVNFQHTLRQFGSNSPCLDVESWRNATEKDRTVACFRRDGIPHMETITLRRPGPEAVIESFESLDRDVWTRPTVGKGGDDVFHVATREQVHHAARHYAEIGQSWQMCRDAMNFDEQGNRHTYRIIVLEDQPLVAVEHVQRDSDSPCNEAKGAISTQLPLCDVPCALIPLAVAAVRSTGLRFGGVDLARENPVVFEVNVHPVIERHLESVAIPWVRAEVTESRVVAQQHTFRP